MKKLNLHKFLFYGIFTSIFLIILGILKYVFLEDNIDIFNYSNFILKNNVFSFNSSNILMLAIFILILTPILRLVVMWVKFYNIKDYKYVIICSIVLFFLIISFFIGLNA